MERTDPRLKPRDSGNNALIVKLERSNNYLQQLKNKLGSYICEPKTWKLYEQKEFLKSRLDRFVDTNTELINSLSDQREEETDGYRDRIRQQLKEFREIQQSILEYIGMARQHC